MNIFSNATYLAFLTFFGFAEKKEQLEIPQTTKQFFQSILIDNSELFEKTKNQVDKNVTLPDQTTPISFAIQHSSFQYCPALIRENFAASVQDLRRAQLLQTLQLSNTKKEEAGICIDLLQKYLQDQKLLPQENIKRGKEDEMTPPNLLAMQLKTKEYALMQATRENNIAKMHDLLQTGANPNTIINHTTPLQIAIAQGHQEALRYLIALKVTVDKSDIEKASSLVEILRSNVESPSNPPDLLIKPSENHGEEELNLFKEINNAKRIYKILKQHFDKVTDDKNSE